MGEKIFSQLENLVRNFQLKYMSSKKTIEVVEPGRIQFHPQDARSWVLKAYQKRLEKLELSFKKN